MEPNKKTPKGQASLTEDRGKIRVRLPRELFGGHRKYLSLGLSTTTEGYKEAERRLRAIQADIDLGRFDQSLEKYKPQCKQQAYLEVVKNLYPEITLFSLWTKYFEYKKPTLKEGTIYYYEKTIAPYIDKSGIESPYQALELREWLLSNTSQSMTKRVLTYVNAAFRWGLKHKLLKGNNPYEGMPSELRHRYQDEATPNAFTYEEKQAVIEAFTNHKGNWNSHHFTGRAYRHYLNFVKFLFMTGCRPNEAVGLRWKDIIGDFKKIRFDGGLVQLGGKKVRSKLSKTNHFREFPCNQKLQELLRQIKPDGSLPDDLVFRSPRGKSINYSDFRRRAWN